MTEETTDQTENLENDTQAEEVSQTEAPVKEEQAAKDAKPESVEDTVRKTFDDLKKVKEDELKTDDPVQGDKAEAPEEPTTNTESGDKKEAEKKGKKGRPNQPRIEPPARWTIEKKEWFNKQPRLAQEEIAKGWGEIEGNTTKLWQDLNRELDDHREVSKILNTYRSQWGDKGITEAQAIAELCATQDNIIKKPLETIARIMQKRGVSIQQLNQFVNGGNGASQQAAPQVPPEFNELTQKVNHLYNSFQSNQQTSQAQALQQAVGEVEQLRNEIDQGGRYRYPELWDQQQLARVKPLVEDLRKNQPSISWAEATKRAVNTLRVLDGKQGIQSPNGQRLSRENEIAKVKAASVSVKGRGNVAIAPSMAAVKGEKLEDTIRRSREFLRNN